VDVDYYALGGLALSATALGTKFFIKGGSSTNPYAGLTRIQILSRNLAPQSEYRAIQSGIFQGYLPQARVGSRPGRGDCLALVDFVDQGFPSDQIPISIRGRCRSWLSI
jgi:hypothetical protein